MSLEVDAKAAAGWISRELLRQLNYRSISLNQTKLNPKIMAQIITLVMDEEITEETGKKLLERVIDSGESPRKIVKEESLGRVSGVDVLDELVERVIKENPEAVCDYKAGKGEALNHLMGKVMREMSHRADAEVVLGLIRDKIS
ncbi:MAG: hypothetical protein B6U97_03670 [Candidatus Altiarchaeales archaeon ex4484_96]|nr:MAG: hypothetical protein B6U97_03670 [Candidatus Altiarchaeales archaeon ex4484_96]